ncbi:L-threonylcarbamoyladenylate synthase [Fodinibius halophilus]|uniref:Threonylcarbamoyl-AMP synthase n=1 Tax=Fodinibius halophilus TaxID=1736908 RepID=A0A6M1TBC5_9BACT|nr:L-threonylcarbamoyladenylate synthase [Fodinibius halophilus]NGP88244.1 threonylcarbamoyl-AMP synthase [Fodinibius halophilus]
MAERIKLHPETPHVKRLFEITDKIRDGAVVLFPTDSQYAIGCDYKNKKGIERIRKIRALGKDDHLTILCDSLSGISKFAHISDHNFKLIKRLIPGPYTFILPATKEVPKLLVHPKKKTVGIRVPDYPITEGLVRELGNPMLAITAKKPSMNGNALAEYEREPFLREFEKLVDVTIDNQQPLPSNETSILDMTDDNTKILRRDLGAKELEEVFRMEREPLEEE